MKKLIIFFAAFIVLSSPAWAKDLAVGIKAASWSFEDSEGTVFSPQNWAGKVLLINYVDPDESDLNEPITEAIKKAKNEGEIKSDLYKGIGIADCAATWKPDMLIRTIAGKKAKKYNTTILFDYDGVLRNLWGLEKDTSNIIILDKNGVCRVLFKGKVPDDKIREIVELCIKMQYE